MGDVILTFPAVRALRSRHPAAHLTAVGSPSLWEMAGDLVDERVSIDAARFSTLYAAEPSPELARWLEDVDRVVAWTVRDPSPALEAAGVREIVHRSPYPPPGVHVSDWLVGSVDPHPPGPLLPRGERGEQIWGRPLPSPPEGERPGVRGALTRIFIHPGAGAIWKRWPAERFATLGETLRDRGHDVVLIEGPADRDAVESVQAAASAPFAVLSDRSLPQLLEDLGSASLFIGNDSGVTHLAALAGAPTVALFGPTDPAIWAPRGNVRILRHCDARSLDTRQIRVCEENCLERMEVVDVLQAARAILDVDNPVDNSAR